MANVISELRKKRNTGTVAKDRSSSDSSKITELRKKRREPELKKVEPFVKFDSSTRYDYDGKPSALKKFNPGTEMKKSIEGSPVTNWERGNVTGAKTPSKDIIGNYLKQQGSKPLTDYQLKYGLDTPPKPQYREDGSRQINPEMLDMYFGPEVARPYYKEQAEYTNRELEEIASKHPVLSSMASVVTNLAKPGDAVKLINAKLRGEELDPNNTKYFGMTNTQNALRQGVTKDMGNVGSFLYSTGMSIVDSLVAGATGSPTAGALLLAGSAGLDATQDAKERGATDSQAIWTGLASGTAEALFERVSLGNFKSLSEVPIKSIQDVAKNTVKSVFVNASEEAATELSNTITDYLIMQDLSNYELAYENYINTGMDEKSAKKQAWLDMAKQIGLSALGGALSGGVMGGVGQGVNYARTSNIGSQIDTEVDTMVDKAKSVEGTDLYQLALEVEKRKQAGKDATNYQKARLAYETQGIKAPVSSLQSDRTDETVQATETLTQETKPPKIEKESVKSADVTWGNVEGAKVKGIATVENNEVKVNIESNGQTVVDRIDNVEFENAEVRAIYDMAEQYKTNGAKSFISNYQDSIDLDTYKKGFDAYYDAGLIELPMDKVNSAQGSLLGENVRYAAYVSGQNDGKVLTPKAVAPDFAGVVENDAMAKMDTNTREGLDALGKAVGVKIQIEESLAGGQANGLYKDGTLYIALDSDNPYMVVAKHEVTHSLQESSPELYKKYKDFVISEINKSNPKVYNEMVDRLISRYSEIGETLTRDQAQDEIVADATEMFFTDSDIISKLANEDKNLAEKIIELIKELITKIQNALQGAEPRSRAAIVLNENLEVAKQAEKLWTEALIGKENIEETGDKGYNEIKNMLLENHEEYKTNKEALKYATEAIQDLGKIRYSLSDAGREVDRAGSGIRTIADGITRDFIQKGYVNLKGIKINSPADLAEIAQVFRDPRFETFRIFYVKNNKIVAHEGVTSRAPGLAVTFMDIPKRSDFKNDSDFRDAVREFQATKFDDMKDRMKRLKADGYYILHNHPSGDPVPSHADILATRGFINGMSGFKGHVIINSNKYCAVDINKLPQDNPIYNLSQQRLDFLLQPSKQHALLGEKINSADTLSAVAKAIQLNKDMSVIIYASSKGEIRGIQEVPNGFVMNDEFKGYIKNQSVEFGSGLTFMHTNSQDVFDRSVELLNQKYITDGVVTDRFGQTSSLRKQGYGQSNDFEWAGMKAGEVSAYRVNEINIFENPRYQLKDVDPIEYRNLKKEHKKLQEAYDLLSQQFALTAEFAPDKTILERRAKSILRKYHSKYDLDTMVENMENIWKYVQSNKDTIQVGQTVNALSGMAKMILEKSTARDTSIRDQYKDLINDIKKTGVMLSDKDRADLASEGGYYAFKRRYRNKIKLVEDGGISIDSYFQELASTYPEFFNADEITHPADQLVKIAEVLDSLKPISYNPYGMNIDEASIDLALEILDQGFLIPQVKPLTAAELKQNLTETEIRQRKELEILHTKYQEKIEDVRNEYRAWYNERLENIKSDNEAQVKKLLALHNKASEHEKEVLMRQIQRLRDSKSQRLQAQQERYSERMKDYKGKQKAKSEMRGHRASIEKNVKTLSDWLSRPKDNKHVPEFLRNTVSNFIQTIDFTKVKSDGNETQKSLKWKETMTRLKQEMRKIDNPENWNNDLKTLKESYIDLDPEFLTRLESFIDNTQVRVLSELDLDQLAELDYLVKVVKKAVTSANQLLANERYKRVTEIGDATIGETQALKEKKQKDGSLGKVDKFLTLDQMDSFTFGDEIGPAGASVIQSLRDGFDKFVLNTKEAIDYIDNIKAKYKDIDIKKLRNTVNTFHVKGGEIKLTTSQIMELYMLSKREQALAHIFGGGIKIENRRIRQGLKKQVLYSYKSTVLSEGDLSSILSTLTQEQKAMAEELREFFDVAAKWGNEVTMKLYDDMKFTEENYYRIKTDENTNKTNDPEATRGLYALRNIGATKATVPNANNPIIISDIFDTFSDHISEMANYNAFVVPLSDTMKWYNYKTKSVDEDGSIDFDTVKQGIERVLGKDGKQYFINLIKDINGIHNQSYSTEIIDTLLRNVKIAAVGLNPSVVLQQPAAYLRAGSVMDYKYILKGLTMKPQIEKAKMYSPIALWKSWGFFDINIGRSLQSLITDEVSTAEKIREKSLWAAGKMDELTWGVLWNAVEAETRDTNPTLEYGSEEFNQTVGKRLSYIVDRTQVVDTVLHRSQMMRSRDTGVKATASFMSEPNKSYNLARTALMNGINKKSPEAIANAFKVVSGVILSNALAAALKSLYTAFGDDDEDEYTKSYLKKFGEEFADNMNPLNLVPLLNDIKSMMDGYAPQEMHLSGLYTLVLNIKAWDKHIWDKYKEGAKKKTIPELLKQSVDGASKTFGIPAGGLLKAMTKAYHGAIDALENAGVLEDVPEYEKLKTKYDISDIDNTKGTSEYYNYLYSIRNTEEYKEVYRELIRSGRRASNINQAMTDRTRDELKENPLLIEAVEAKERKDTTGYKAAIDKLQKDYTAKDILSAISSMESEKAKSNAPSPEEFIEAYKTGDETKWKPLFQKMRAAGWKQEDILALVK